MIQDLTIVHRLKPMIFANPQSGPIWSTCLRSLAFGGVTVGSADEVYAQENAYRFLLEVVCGLKSPIVGETEVFGQFKVFSEEWLKFEPRRASLVQKILADAKAIRSEYLTNLGVQSYGSWVRSKVTETRVHFLGGGQLVGEIYPYLAKQERDLVLHLREPAKGSGFAAPSYSLSRHAFDHGTLIVAAPLSAKEIEQWLNGRVPNQVIDLRDNSSDDALTFTRRTKVHLLADIFSQIENTKAKLSPRLEHVQREIIERSKKAATQSQLRPQGWDDLCA